MNQKVLTMRTIFERATLERLRDESELAHSIPLSAKCEVKPVNDHFLAVFVYEAESQEDGTLRLRPISTTVVGIQRFTTKRLGYQGIFVMTNPDKDQIPFQTLRAHFRGEDQVLRERLESMHGPKLRWTKEFENGAGDLNDQVEFVIEDPDVADLNKLFNLGREEGDDPDDNDDE